MSEWADRKEIFFVLAIGRSGTNFLAQLLNKTDGAYVEHEPAHEDFEAHQDAFHSQKQARKYIQKFRKKEIYLRCRNRNFTTYGEVNSVLRRHAAALKEAFPKATILHLVRDGRDVVRSMISRKTMLPEDPNTQRIYPIKGGPFYEKWDTMSRFARLCWYWQVENQYLRNCIGKQIYFERLTSDYQYFKKNLLDPVGISLSEDVWSQSVSNPKNITQKFQMPPWQEWDQEFIKTFYEICGQEMKQYDFT